MPASITVKRAEAHEALHLQLERLAQLAAGVAARSPNAPVPDEVRIRAEDLLHACQRFALPGRPRRGRHGLEPAAPTYGGLGAQLGEALAGLDAYEDRHTRWDPGLKCVVWRVAGDALPVQRLNPKPVVRPPRRSADGPSEGVAKLIRRIDEKITIAYAEGYADGRAGRPMGQAPTVAAASAEINQG